MHLRQLKTGKTCLECQATKQHGNQDLIKEAKGSYINLFPFGNINILTQHFYRINQSRHTKRQATTFKFQLLHSLRQQQASNYISSTSLPARHNLLNHPLR